MIVYISMMPAEMATVDQSMLTLAIAEVARAYRRGNHLMIIPRSTGQWLIDNLPLSSADASAVREIAASYAQLGSILSVARTYIEISTLKSERIESSRQTIIRLCLKDIINGDLLSPSVLVVEDNDSDGRFYEYVMENVKDKFKVPKLKLEIRHGGGSRTIGALKSSLKMQRVAVCIVDSERVSPFDPRKCPTVKIHREIAATGAVAFCVVTPPARELENLIPLPVLAELPCASSTLAMRHLDRIAASELPLNTNDRFHLYFDMKKGFKSGVASTLPSVQCRKWMEERLSIISKDTNEVSILGFGEKVISQIFHRNVHQARLRTHIRHESWIEIFHTFLTETIWFFCAGSAQRT